MKKRQLSFILAALLLLAGGLLTGCQSGGAAVLEGPPILREDLMERTLFMQPFYGYMSGKVRTVDDSEFFNQVVDLCAEAEPFRPAVLAYDMKADIPWMAHSYFRGAADEYIFSFVDVGRQLDFDFVHRDKPLICIGKASVPEEGIYDGYYRVEWRWLYTLPASNYAVLYNLTEKYGGGKVIDEWQRWEP